MVENVDANSPRVKSKPRTRQGRRVARRGGRLGLRLVCGLLATTIDLCFGSRWSGGVRELGLYSPVVL
jgi:hypothetical protein